MEYSLYTLNQSCKLNQLTFTNIINKLNLIGFEVDDIIREELLTNSNLENIRLLIKIPSNRDDLLNETFFVTELTTIFLLDLYDSWKNIRQKYFFLFKQNYLKYSHYETIEILTPFSDILMYSIEFDRLESFSTPKWIEKKLISNGLPITNNITDLLTLVTFEWGQSINISKYVEKKTKEPLDCLRNQSIPAQFSIARLTQQTDYIINETSRIKLDPGTIVIKDSFNQILSVLGIFNSFPIKFSKNKIIFEAIYYDIEKNNLNLNLINTKIPLRFLRKTYLENFKFSFQRLLTLLEILGNNKIGFKKYKTLKTIISLTNKKILKLEKKSLKNFLNIEKYEKDIFKKANLKLVCETQNEMYFQIPNSRNDLIREIDLIEEYSRFIGYKNFQEILPQKNLVYSKNLKSVNHFIKEFFLNYGFHEIVTSSIEDLTTKKLNSIRINNPLTNALSVLRSDLLMQMVSIFETNMKLGFTNNNFFEIGRVFKTSNKRFVEQEKVAGIFTYPFSKLNKQPSLEWFITKGFLENFLTNFGYKNIQIQPLKTINSVYHPTKSILIKNGENILGKFGEFNPLLQKNLNTKTPIYVFEFNLHHFKKWRITNEIIIYNEYSKYPPITKDLSFVISKEENFTKIREIIEKEINSVTKIEFFDIYYDPINLKNINIGLRLEFQSKTKTLVNEFIENQINQIKELLLKNFKIEFRE